MLRACIAYVYDNDEEDDDGGDDDGDGEDAAY